MVDRPAALARLEELVYESRRPQYSYATSERDILEHLVVPLLRDVLGWDTGIEGFNRERYARGAGYADGVLMADGHPIVYLEAKRLGKIPALAELRGRSAFYSQEEEQALRYARRSADMNDGERWTVLTNFHQLRVFEATREDRVLSFEQPEMLVANFDELLLLSKSSVQDGSLRRHLEQSRKRPIDEEFRETLNRWRRRLAQALYDGNRARFAPGGDLDLRSLQAAVQRLLDRLIVVQFATDVDALGEEDPLRDLLARTLPPRGPRPLVRPPGLRELLFDAFRSFDSYYNTSLFAPGHLIESLDVDEQVLRDIVEGVAGQSFRRLDADILGTTYETYLGHQLRVVNEVVELDLRPEVRRAGGVYYTPIEVVSDIINRTVRARLAEATTVEQVDAITVVDPACGSGSFLIRAFDAFADWYESENERRANAAIASTAAPTLEAAAELPIQDYGRRILERNLYGVDLDPEAAELAAVNLIMQAVRRGRIGIGLHRLPLVLGQNVKVGNSVVPGFIRGGASPQTDGDALTAARNARIGLRGINDNTAELAAVATVQGVVDPLRRDFETAFVGAHPTLESRSPFAWRVEFPEIFDPSLPEDQQGFAVVVGNPPWIGFTGSNVDRPYLAATFEAASGRFDMYVPFFELALSLVKPGGTVGLITPSNFFLRDYGARLRHILKHDSTIEILIDFGSRQLFRGATNYPAITVLRRTSPPNEHELAYLRETYDIGAGRMHRQDQLSDDGWQFLSSDEEAVLGHVASLADVVQLDAVCRIDAGSSGLAEGVVTGQNQVFLVDQAFAATRAFESDIVRPCVKGEDVARWSVATPTRALIYPYRAGNVLSEEEMAQHPNIYGWLGGWRNVSSDEKGLDGRAYFDASGKTWYELWNERSEAVIGVPKIVAPEVNDRPEFALVDAEIAFTDSVLSATPSVSSGVCREYLVGLLNSRLMAMWHARQSVPKANGYLVFRPAFLKRLPVRTIDMTGEDRALHDDVVDRVRLCTETSSAIHGLDEVFLHYVEEYTVTTRTLTGVLNALGRDARENLCTDGGVLASLSTRREAGRLLVVGKARRTGAEYEAGEWEQLDLIRLTVSEALTAFLEAYLPVATRFARNSGRRTLSARAGDILLPDVTDTQAASAVVTYSTEVARGQVLREELKRLEAEIDERVAELYRLTPAMRRAVSAFTAPADLLRALGNPAGEVGIDPA